MTTTPLGRPLRSRPHQLAALTRPQLLKLARDRARNATPEMLCALAATLPDDTLICAVLALEETEEGRHVAHDV